MVLKKLFEKMGNSFRRFMRGRYGNDELNIFLLVLCTVFAFLSFIPQLYGISILTLVTLIWTSFRSLSKNHVKRRKELDVYRRMKNRMSKWFSLRKDMWRDRKTHTYFKCPKCKAVIRVPKRRGGGIVNCPKCGNKITRK